MLVFNVLSVQENDEIKTSAQNDQIKLNPMAGGLLIRKVNIRSALRRDYVVCGGFGILLLSDCFVCRQDVSCLKRFTSYGQYAGEVDDIIIGSSKIIVQKVRVFSLVMDDFKISKLDHH